MGRKKHQKMSGNGNRVIVIKKGTVRSVFFTFPSYLHEYLSI